jgi:hypothetical protein
VEWSHAFTYQLADGVVVQSAASVDHEGHIDGLPDPAEAINVDAHRALGAEVHVADGDGQAVHTRLGHESYGFVGVGQQGAIIFTEAGQPAQLRLDLHPGGMGSLDEELR